MKRVEPLTEREQRVLEAVIRTFVATAEPAGSRTVAKRSGLGVSAATVRNTMADLEEKGFLYHPHTSAGRIPTDLAYRFYVDTLMEPVTLTPDEHERIRNVLGESEKADLERLIRNATQVLGLLTGELGVAVAPRLDDTLLEKIELISVSEKKVLLVVTLRNKMVRTVYVNVPASVPGEALVSVTMVLNERLAGQTLAEIRKTLPDRLRDSGTEGDESATQLLNIFLESADDLFELSSEDLHLGRTSVLANQPEFASSSRLRGLLELTEQRDLLAHVLAGRGTEPAVEITIGEENQHPDLRGFTLMTAGYRVGGLAGVVGVMGPTRMPYAKVAAIVDCTSSLVTELVAVHADAIGSAGSGQAAVNG